MSFSFAGLPRGYRYPQAQALTSFAGGVNQRDAASELAANEVIDSWNVTFDERGGASSRLGYTKYNNSPYAALVQNVFWWEAAQHLLVNAGNKLYRDTSTSSVKTFSTTDLVTFAEIAGKVICSHPVDGMFSSTDGSTWIPAGQMGTATVTIATPAVVTYAAHGLAAGDQVYFETSGALPTGITADTTYYVLAAGLTANTFQFSTTAGGTAVNTSGSQSGTHTLFHVTPKGACLCVWQNKLWLAGQTTNPARVSFCAPGDPSYWPALNFVDLRDKDNAQVVALTVGSGLDISGAAGMLAFKQESTYRINDSTTGAYQTIDSTVGAAGPLAVTVVGAKVVALSQHGIFWWQNGLSGLQNGSAQLEPFWNASQINFSKLNLMCAGRSGRTARFSLPTVSSSVNNLCLEFHTDLGWIAPRSDAASCYTVYGNQTEHLVGGSPTVVGQVYQYDTGGTDDGAAIAGRLQTRWIDLLGGYKASVLHLRVRGRGSGTLQFRRDYHESGDSVPFQLADTNGVFYDTGLHYDEGDTYYLPDEEPTQTFYSVGACRQLSLVFTFSNSTTVTGPAVLNSSVLPQRGPFGLFEIEMLFMRLGINQ